MSPQISQKMTLFFGVAARNRWSNRDMTANHESHITESHPSHLESSMKDEEVLQRSCDNTVTTIKWPETLEMGTTFLQIAIHVVSSDKCTMAAISQSLVLYVKPLTYSNVSLVLFTPPLHLLSLFAAYIFRPLLFTYTHFLYFMYALN